MTIRLYNARILTMQDAFLLSGELHVKDGSISYVGPSLESDSLQDSHFDKEIDCKNNILMPGFKNGHAHGPMTFLRSKADDMPLDLWLNQQVFPAEAKLTEEDTYWLHKLAILEYLSSGITSSFEMYFIDEGIEQASLDMGFRTVFSGALVGSDVQWLKRLEDRYQKVNQKGGLLSYQFGFHAEYSTSRELIEGVVSLAKQYQAPVYTHCQETEKETLGCIERYGKTPVQFFSEIGMFEYGGGLFHMVHPMDGDMECMLEHNVAVVSNPGSNAKLASGIAPLEQYVNAGVLVGLGTDGPASNNCLDMFWEMHLASGLQKIKEGRADALPAEQVLSMATVNGARIMGLSDCDTLSVGKRADIVMIDMHQPNMQPEHDFVKNLVYSGNKRNVLMTMVDGEILFENGIYPSSYHVNEIYEKCNAITKRICS